jgi:hypothetical protein
MFTPAIVDDVSPSSSAVAARMRVGRTGACGLPAGMREKVVHSTTVIA